MLSFILGVGSGNLFFFPRALLIEEIVLLVLILVWKIKFIRIILIVFALALLGNWHYHRELDRRLKVNIPYGEKITVIGIVNDYPKEEANKTNLTVKFTDYQLLVSAPRTFDWQYQDKIKIKGFIKKPERVDNFNYPAFLAKDNIQGVISYPESIEKIGEDKGGLVKKNIFKFKKKITEVIRKSVRFPESAFLEGMILGEMGMLTEKINNNFRLTGLSHIIVISGLHISLLAATLKSLKIKTPFLIILLLGFVILSGSAPSTLRSFILFLSLILAKVAGRKANPARLLIFIATILLISNPLLLLHDLSFQLSFLAILSLIYFTPIFEKIIEGRLLFIPREIIDNLIVAASAQILTWPIISYNFGKISLIAPFANVLVIPLASTLIILGLLIGLAGLAFLPLAKILAILSLPVFSYTLAVPKLLSTLPGAFTEAKISVWSVLIYYIIIAIFIYQWNLRLKKNENSY